MRTADRFCDLAGFDPDREEPVVYAHDGSQLTLIEIDGVRSIVSVQDYLHNVVERFAGGISPERDKVIVQLREAFPEPVRLLL